MAIDVETSTRIHYFGPENRKRVIDATFKALFGAQTGRSHSFAEKEADILDSSTRFQKKKQANRI